MSIPKVFPNGVTASECKAHINECNASLTTIQKLLIVKHKSWSASAVSVEARR